MSKTSHLASVAIAFVVISLIILFFPERGNKFIVFFSGTGMKGPASEIANNFTNLTGIAVDVHFEGSSILRQYIEMYKGGDIFLSGDKMNIKILLNKGIVKEHTFVAWHIPSILIPPENREKIKGLSDLSKKGVRFVMSNPELAASGKLANEAISKHPKANEILTNVTVYGSSTTDSFDQFWDLYRKGKADAIIEWDVMAYTPEGKGLIIVPFEKEYEVKDSIILALLINSRKNDASKRFYEYFKTEGIKMFKKYGNTEAAE